jgi:3-keto-disaccharide hydrolase
MAESVGRFSCYDLTHGFRTSKRRETRHIIQRDGDMTTIWLNGQLVVDHVKMENYWDYSKPLPAKGNIELQYHGDKLYWKNIYARDLK